MVSGCSQCQTKEHLMSLTYKEFFRAIDVAQQTRPDSQIWVDAFLLQLSGMLCAALNEPTSYPPNIIYKFTLSAMELSEDHQLTCDLLNCALDMHECQEPEKLINIQYILDAMFAHHANGDDYASRAICLDIMPMRAGLYWQFVNACASPHDDEPVTEVSTHCLDASIDHDPHTLMIQWMAYVLRMIEPTTSAWSQQTQSASDIASQLKAAKLIDATHTGTLERGVDALFSGAHSSAFALLMPRLEETIRSLYHKVTCYGVREPQPNKERLSTLEGILCDDDALGLHGHPRARTLSTLLRYMLVELRPGLNLRNALSHGQWYKGPWQKGHAWATYLAILEVYQLSEAHDER